ncbi:uncharacterized protein DS421_1g15830 [Arachis hypogaea]|nr:uncharacterized protein DS421_1g15830 [Arachis hypogaea]
MLKVPLLTPDLAEAFISLLQGERFSKPNLFCTLGLLVSAVWVELLVSSPLMT